MLEKTSTEDAPWYVLPADNKWYTRFLVSEIVLQKMKELDPKFPELPEDAKSRMEECRALLLKDV